MKDPTVPEVTKQWLDDHSNPYLDSLGYTLFAIQARDRALNAPTIGKANEYWDEFGRHIANLEKLWSNGSIDYNPSKLIIALRESPPDFDVIKEEIAVLVGIIRSILRDLRSVQLIEER